MHFLYMLYSAVSLNEREAVYILDPPPPSFYVFLDLVFEIQCYV